jgi:hypothetical protein
MFLYMSLKSSLIMIDLMTLIWKEQEGAFS